jgi:hypothetical protein
MKNFSISGAALAVALLVASPAQAANCKFRADAPDQHKVVKGDTLWDISAKFLDNPWCWPQVWGLNKDQIRDPHWIYPGQTIWFDRANQRLSLNPPGSGGGSGAASDPPVLRLSPQLRTEGLGKDAIPSIPSSVIEPFLSHPMIVEQGDIQGAPRIAAAPEARQMLGKGDKIYVAGELKGGTSFQVFRPGTELRDPDTGKVIAHEAFYLGTVKLAAEKTAGVDVHTFNISSAKQEMAVGDLLRQAPPTPLMNYVPHQPLMPVSARVVAVYNGVKFAGQNQVISINRGSVDGLDVGATLQLHNKGATVVDPVKRGVAGYGAGKLKLPDEVYGTLFIFRVFKNMSYGLIMQVTEPVQVGDVAKSPE